MQVLESDIERACKRYAEKVGAELLKLQGTKGWPDRLLMYKGVVVFIEFKRPGAEPEPLQQHYLNELQERGYIALWLTSLKAFKLVLGALTHTKIAELISSQKELQQRCSSLQD